MEKNKLRVILDYEKLSNELKEHIKEKYKDEHSDIEYLSENENYEED